MDTKLVMFKPDGRKKAFPLAKAVTMIGRGQDCDLRVPLDIVSRHHCRVSLQQDKVEIKDLGSSNGTYVNNRRITETGLSAGDRLAIGSIIFTVQIDGQPEDIRPVETRGQRSARDAHDAMAEVELVANEAEGEGQALSALANGSGQGDSQEVDPISALEALADESKKKEQDEQ